MSVIEKENFPSESIEQEEEKKLEFSDPVAITPSSSEVLAGFGIPPSSPPREMAVVEDEPMVSTEATVTIVQEVIETELTVEGLPDKLPATVIEEEAVEEKKEEAVDDDKEVEEEEWDEEENEHAPALFEQPLIIEGKRHRVSTQALQYDSPANTTKYRGGNGSELGNDPHFVEIVGKKTTEELKPLHKLLYGNPGKHAILKRELRRFSGFNFDESSQEFAKKHKMLTGLKSKELGLIQSAFRKFYWPEDKKDKDAYATELLKVLLSPPDLTATGKTPRGKASSQTPTRRKRTASDAHKPKTKRMRRSKKIVENEDESDEVSDHEEKEEEEESTGSGEEKTKEKKEPSFESLSDSINEIIKVADFNTLNTKGIIDQLVVKYPKMNVEKRRPDIKKIIKEVIQQHVPVEGEAE